MTRVVLCGGDGLVHRAVQFLACQPVEVAIVPTGTGNDFARAFGIGGAAATTLAASAPGSAHVSSADLMAIEPAGAPAAGDTANAGAAAITYAASVVTAGYSGRVNETANRLRCPRGSAKYTIAALLEIGRLRSRPMRLTVEAPTGERTVIEGPTTLVAVANTAFFGGGMKICPDAEPSDGLVDVMSVGALGRVELVRWLPKVFRGSHVRHRAVTSTRGASVTVETDESLWADGEPVGLGGGAVTVRLAPGALRLLTP